MISSSSLDAGGSRPGFSAAFNLGDEFDNEAGSKRDNLGDSNLNYKRNFDEEMDDDDDVPPAPPSHSLDEEDYADYFGNGEKIDNENVINHNEENSNDDDDSIFNLHLGHRSQYANKPNANDDNGNRIGSNLTFDSYDDFGEETLNAIMDADLRLSAIPPFSTNFSSTAETGGRTNYDTFSSENSSGRGLRSIPDRSSKNIFPSIQSNRFQNFQEREIDSIAKNLGMSARSSGAREFSLNEADEMDDMSSDGVDSILRGPLMAAQSSARARYKETGTSRMFDNQGESSDMKALHRSEEKLVSYSAGGKFTVSPQDPSTKGTLGGHFNPSGMAQTPSAARNQLLPSPRMGTTPPNPGAVPSAASGSSPKSKSALSHSSKSVSNQVASTTPSEVRNKFFTSPQDPSPIPLPPPSSRPSSRQSPAFYETPSNVREIFMSYPSQESATSIGSRNPTPSTLPPPSHHANHSAGKSGTVTDSANKENIVEKWMDCLSDVHGNVKSTHYAPNEKKNTCASGSSGNGRLRDQHNGEKNPVLDGANDDIDYSRSPMVIGNTNSGSLEDIIALGEAQMLHAFNKINDTAAINHSDKSHNDNTNLPPKKSFLRKGTRKEPSSLHKLPRDAAKPDSSAQLSNNNAPGKSNPNETSQERKARLAQLEQLQLDCLKDLEKRQQRKEEARKERRSYKVKEIGSKVVSTRTSSEQDGQNQQTPSQMRPRPMVASKVKQSAAKSKNNHPLPSQSRRSAPIDKEEHPTPSQMRPLSTSKEIPPKVIDADVHNVSGITECSEHPTPSQFRQPSTTSQHEISYHFDEEKSELAEEGAEEEIGDKKNGPSDDYCVTETKKANKLRRSLSAPRPKNDNANQQTKFGRNRDVKNSNDGDDKEAFEEWKRKEEEQWSLIKNMRKRQEAALREAEGELQRAKAWAAAERESVHKWADEQRELIRKDRHKAANAALLASKKANKEIKKNGNISGGEGTKSEIDNLRAELKKMKIEAEKAEKLKEKVSQQEKRIKQLLSEKSHQEKLSSKATPKSNSGSKGVLNDSTTKQNRLGPSKPETREASGKVILKSTKSRKAPDNMQQQMVPNDDEVTTLTEGPSNRFFQRSLETPNNANNKLDNKLNKVKEPFIADPNLANQSEACQRKPYNAADYISNDGAKQPLERSAPHQMSSGMMPSPIIQNSGHDASNSQVPEKCQVFTYRNGTQKTVQPDGTTTITFANGDKKRTYANEKKGIVVYYYAATKTTQITHQNGMETYHFPNNQIENHHRDGRKEITYPDGTKRLVYPDGSCDTKFPDGVRVMEYPDGTQQVTQVY
ncbi:hypothetical protein ACHAXS_010631 [Conticribra weissflogii]